MAGGVDVGAVIGGRALLLCPFSSLALTSCSRRCECVAVGESAHRHGWMVGEIEKVSEEIFWFVCPIIDLFDLHRLLF